MIIAFLTVPIIRNIISHKYLCYLKPQRNRSYITQHARITFYKILLNDRYFLSFPSNLQKHHDRWKHFNGDALMLTCNYFKLIDVFEDIKETFHLWRGLSKLHFSYPKPKPQLFYINKNVIVQNRYFFPGI